MTVADYIEHHRARLIEQYAAKAAELAAGRGLTHAELVDTFPEYLTTLAVLSQGHAPDADADRQRFEETHIGLRLRLGFQLHEVIREYMAIGELISALWADLPDGQPPAEDVGRLFAALESSMNRATAIYSGYTVEDRQTEKHYLRRLEALARELSERGDDGPERLSPLAAVIQEAVQADGAALFLLDADGRTLRPAARAGLCESMGQDSYSLEEPSLLNRLADSEETVYVPDLGPAEGAVGVALRQCGLRSLLGLRLYPYGKLLGMLCIGVDDIHPFPPRIRHYLEVLADHLAGTVERAWLTDALRQSARAREETLRIVSHDLRSPLTSMLLHADMLKRAAARTPLEAVVLRQVASIRRSGEQMERLITDLADIRSIETGQFAVETHPCDPLELMTDAVELHRPAAEDRQVTLSWEAPEGLPRVRCDHGRIHQVFGNLITNALKVTAAGGRVCLEARPADKEVIFGVTDTGTGIAEQDLPWIFERYWRGQAAGYQGSGLGLAIVKGIVDAHRGRLWVESQPGVGSRFYFSLPQADTEPRPTP